MARVSTDPKVDFTRGGKVKLTPADIGKMKKDLVEQISSWTGGPLHYTGPDMKEVHKSMGITNAQFDAFVADTREVLQENGDLRRRRHRHPQGHQRFPQGRRGQGGTQNGAEARAGEDLWDRLGGQAGVTRIIDDLVAAVATDPRVDFFRGGKFKLDAAGVARLKKLLVEQVSSLTGGPLKYDGLGMKEAHKGMGITVVQYDAFMDHVKEVLEKNKVAPGDVATIVTALNSYRKDIIEPAKKPEEKKPEEKKPEEKKPEEKKPAPQ